jgi:hypothetical protein
VETLRRMVEAQQGESGIGEDRLERLLSYLTN